VARCSPRATTNAARRLLLNDTRTGERNERAAHRRTIARCPREKKKAEARLAVFCAPRTRKLMSAAGVRRPTGALPCRRPSLAPAEKEEEARKRGTTRRAKPDGWWE
jgi:hypothetical protein